MRALRKILSGTLVCLPVALTLVYGLLVTSPKGEAGRDFRLQVAGDARVELAAILARVAGDPTGVWPVLPGQTDSGPALSRFGNHPASLRVREWMRRGFTSEMLARLLMMRGPLPDLAGPVSPPPIALLADPGQGSSFDAAAAGITPAAVESLMADTREFARAIDFDAAWESIQPALDARAQDIEEDQTLGSLVARLNDFFGERTVRRPIIIPTFFGPWKGPFALTDPSGEEIRVVDRASGVGRLTPETSLSWVCVREFARPTVEKLAREHREKIASLSDYWNYLKQGIAASTTTGWEDCLNAHLYRAIDLRVRPQEDAAERELRVSSALQAGLGMIRVLDAKMTGFDRSRGFYHRFTDFYPTLLEEMAGLEARVRVQRPRLGLKVVPTRAGLRIDEIVPGFSAEISPLKPGDIIMEADGRPILAEETLAQMVQSRPMGDSLAVVVERQGQRRQFSVPLTRGRVEYEFFRPEVQKSAR